LDADFLESDPFKVQFRQKRTYDAGATPDLEDFERPELKSIGGDLVEELEEISERESKRENKLEQLEKRLDQKEERIQELDAELEKARDHREIVDRLSEALEEANGGNGDRFETIKAEVMEVRQAKRELEDDYEVVKQERDELAERVAELETDLGERAAAEDLRALKDELNEFIHRHNSVLSVGGEDAALRERLQRLEDENKRLKRNKPAESQEVEILSRLDGDGIQAAIQTAKDDSKYSVEHFDQILELLAVADGGPKTAGEIEPLTDVSASTVRSVLNDLYRVGVVEREKNGRRNLYNLDRELLESRNNVAQQSSQARTEELT
jgi:chromosome segregation ATPase